MVSAQFIGPLTENETTHMDASDSDDEDFDKEDSTPKISRDFNATELLEKMKSLG